MDYISHKDYKDLMSKFQEGTPKRMLKENTGIEEETTDGSHMRHPERAAEVVAQKHKEELKQALSAYDEAYDEGDPKARAQAYKEFENKAISWCGEEMMKAGMKRIVASNLLSGYGYFEDWLPDYLDALVHELREVKEGNAFTAALAKTSKGGTATIRGKKIKDTSNYDDPSVKEYSYTDNYPGSWGYREESLHMPPLQATGQTIDVVENSDESAPYGFSVLSPDERQQLKEYINSIKTIKEEIAKLVGKAGKKIREDKSKLGGDRTGLVMTKSKMYEGEDDMHDRIEGLLDTKLHDAFHKVTGLIVKDLMADGFDKEDVLMFLKHEIEEKGKEAAMSQYDPY